MSDGVVDGKGSAARRMLPPPPRAPRQQTAIVSDDEYEQKMAAIIERDYFPNIKRLQNKLEWMQAAESGDSEVLSRAQHNIVLRRAGYSVPVGAEILPEPAATPSQRTTGVMSSRSNASTRAGAQGQRGSGPALPAGTVLPPQGTLEDYAAGVVSEDQDSVMAILDADNSKRMEGYDWAFSGSEQANKSAITSVGAAAPAQDAPERVTWHHNVKNSLFYVPDALQIADRAPSQPQLTTVEQPSIQKRNTRFESASELAHAAHDGATGGSLSTMPTSATPSEADTRGNSDALANVPEESPAVSQIGGVTGYKRMPTPSPAPTLLAEQPMTWGEVAGTPMVLEAEDTPMHKAPTLGAGLSKKERAARTAHRAMAGRSTRRRLDRSTPTASPGVQQMKHFYAKKIRGDVDWQLRASHGLKTPGSSRRAPGTGGETPGTTPAHVRVGLFGEMTPEVQR